MKKMMITTVAAMTALTMMTGCQAKPSENTTPPTTQETTQAKEVNLDEIHTAVKDAYGDQYIPSMPYDEQMMEDLFGLKKELYDSYIAEGPMISVHVDNFVAIKAQKGKGEEVQSVMDAYRESMVTDSMQYPMNMPKVQASEVVRHGDYVFFVMLGELSDEALNQGEEAALEAAKENNKIAIDVIDGFFQ